jgi:hypothetical protein
MDGIAERPHPSGRAFLRDVSAQLTTKKRVEHLNRLGSLTTKPLQGIRTLARSSAFNERRLRSQASPSGFRKVPGIWHGSGPV